MVDFTVSLLSQGNGAASPLGDGAASPLGDGAASPPGDGAASPLGDGAASLVACCLAVSLLALVGWPPVIHYNRKAGPGAGSLVQIWLRPQFT